MADEVPRLAERTGHAPAAITGMLEAIITETGNAAGHIQGTLGAVSENAQMTTTAGERMLAMTKSMRSAVDARGY